MQALAVSHAFPVGSPVRWHLGDVRTTHPSTGVGRIVEHAWRHGVVPMYWVETQRPVALVTGEHTRRLLFFPGQLDLPSAPAIREARLGGAFTRRGIRPGT